ncbi:MAG: ABC transporter substrate-binding protein [Tenuifilaceae bacterium]|jgi:iron complex transport system substrate-binding protein|nr:ABC transporter substrate-binding protein [Tenuifilaceae bacterium]
MHILGRLSSSLVVLAFILSSSCVQKPNPDSLVSSPDSLKVAVDYANGFSINRLSQGFQLTVTNPWQDAKGISYKYLLTSDGKVSPKGYSEVIPIPVKSVVCLSTTHIAFIDRLSMTSSVVGVSGTNFVTSKRVQERIESGLVRDVGYEQALNYELLVSLKPDVVLAYGVGAEMAGYLQKLKDLNIPVVFVGDYLEESPLGKTEWLKAFGLLFDDLPKADSIFNRIAFEYNSVMGYLPKDQKNPTVFLNLPWKDVWYFPGGQGYMANLIADAGGNYSLSHLKGNRSYPFSIENALEYAITSDIWLNTGMANSLSEVANELPIAKSLPILAEGRVFNNNNRVNPTGGNDFWESGVVNPHIILKDLIKIFHPNHIQHELVYYKQLQ